MERIRVSNAEYDRQLEVRIRLKQYRALVERYAAYNEVYEQLFPRITQTLSDMPRGGTGESCELERVVQQRMELQNAINEALQDMRNELQSIMEMIKALPGEEHTIILWRYVLAYSWKNIIRKMNYCERQVHRIHGRAIMHIANNMSVNVS